jgi:hypothetical protein
MARVNAPLKVSIYQALKLVVIPIKTTDPPTVLSSETARGILSRKRERSGVNFGGIRTAFNLTNIQTVPFGTLLAALSDQDLEAFVEAAAYQEKIPTMTLLFSAASAGILDRLAKAAHASGTLRW